MLHLSCIDLFADAAAILISIVSNNYYGMPRGQIHINVPPEYPIMCFGTMKIKMAAVSAKRSMRGSRIACQFSEHSKRQLSDKKVRIVIFKLPFMSSKEARNKF